MLYFTDPYDDEEPFYEEIYIQEAEELIWDEERQQLNKQP